MSQLVDAIMVFAQTSIDRTTAGIAIVVAIASTVIFLGLVLRRRS